MTTQEYLSAGSLKLKYLQMCVVERVRVVVVVVVDPLELPHLKTCVSTALISGCVSWLS